MFRPFKKFRRHFPDRCEARSNLAWMPIGKTIKIWYSKFRSEFVTMTESGLKFHNYTDKHKE